MRFGAPGSSYEGPFGTTPSAAGHGHSIKVLLVEDSKVLAERLSEAISEYPQFDIIGIVDTEADALRFIESRRVDLVLLDLHLRAGTGFGVIRALAATHRRPQIVILTNHDLPEYHTAALNLGVVDFLDKARAFHRLPQILAESEHSFRPD